MDFGEAIKVCFNKFANFEGRARRSEFWWFQLFTYIISSLTCGIGGLVLLLPTIAVTARRLHDTGRSGWLQLLMFIPIVGYVLIIIWTVQDSDPGTNEYGPNPKVEPIAVKKITYQAVSQIIKWHSFFVCIIPPKFGKKSNKWALPKNGRAIILPILIK